MNKIFIIFIKELKLLIRDPAGLILLFILPALFILVLSISLQGVFASPDKKEQLDILAVNNDKGNIGNKILKELAYTGYFKIIEKIDDKVLDSTTAKKELRKGNYKIYIYIPENATKAHNFNEKAVITIYVDPVLSNDFASQITNAVQTFIHLGIIKNISNISINVFEEIKSERLKEISNQLNDTKLKKSQLEKEISEIKESDMDENIKQIFDNLAFSSIQELDDKIKELNKQIQTIQNNNNPDNLQISEIISKNKGLFVKQTYYYGEKDSEIFPNSVQQNVPGWTIFALFWIVQIISLNIISERESGVFKRILISPVNSFTYLSGKILPFFFINLIQACLLFCIGVFVLPLFGCPALMLKNIPAIILLTCCVSISAISLGLMISCICKSTVVAATLSAILIILMAVLGGIMVPKFIMPRFMQSISLFVPHGWALDGYLNIFVRDYKILQILPNAGILLLFSLAFFIVALLNFNRISSFNK